MAMQQQQQRQYAQAQAAQASSAKVPTAFYRKRNMPDGQFELKDAYFRNGQNVTWNWSDPQILKPIYWDNPYWTRYKNYEEDHRIRYFGFMKLDYKITSWLDAMGRATNVVQPDGTSVNHVFSLRGELLRTSGTRTYPVGYAYDAQGRMKHMTNWSGFSANAFRD